METKFGPNEGVKGAVSGPRGAHLAGRRVPLKIWEMPFIPARSYACMSSSLPPETSKDG
jgi:hypothetical protein